jgi:hypothetical protein
MLETNGIIEREVQDMLGGTRTIMFAAGFPGYVWSVAAPCYMHLDNCIPHLATGVDAWSQRYGEPFSGQLIPFGAAVWLKPARTKHVTDKPLPTGVFGVFLGYRFAPGGAWNGEYLVEDLSYFLDLDFSQEALGHARVLAPHVTKQVRLPSSGESVFPLKRHYDRVNFTFKGQSGHFDKADDMFDLPDIDDVPPCDDHDAREGGDVTATVENQVVFDYGIDSLGRRYPRGIYSHRVIPGNPRPVDFPREFGGP